MIHFIRTYGNLDLLAGLPFLVWGITFGSKWAFLLGALTLGSGSLRRAWQQAVGRRLPKQNSARIAFVAIDLVGRPALIAVTAWLVFPVMQAVFIALVFTAFPLLFVYWTAQEGKSVRTDAAPENSSPAISGSRINHWYRHHPRTFLAMVLTPWSYIVGVLVPENYPLLLIVSWTLRFIFLLLAIPRAHLLQVHWRGRKAVFRQDMLNIVRVSVVYATGGVLDALGGYVLGQGAQELEVTLWMVLATTFGLQIACTLKLTSYRHIHTVRAIVTLIVGVPAFIFSIALIASYGPYAGFPLLALLITGPWIVLRMAASRGKDMLPLFSGQLG